MRKLLTYVLIGGVGFYLYNEYKATSKVKPKLNTK